EVVGELIDAVRLPEQVLEHRAPRGIGHGPERVCSCGKSVWRIGNHMVTYYLHASPAVKAREFTWPTPRTSQHALRLRMLLQDRPVVMTSQAGNSAAAQPTPPATPKIQVAGMNFYYGARRVLENITLNVQPNQVTALIGPSGCGKSTFLRSLNRMN